VHPLQHAHRLCGDSDALLPSNAAPARSRGDCAPADPSDPRASPLRRRLESLPPAFVVTAEFDPLRDEGIAYAEALAAAGVPVEQLQARGHIHSSFTMVDVLATAVSSREKMAQALQRFAGREEPGALPRAAE
jgi:acetyl esterase/lipase